MESGVMMITLMLWFMIFITTSLLCCSHRTWWQSGDDGEIENDVEGNGNNHEDKYNNNDADHKN